MAIVRDTSAKGVDTTSTGQSFNMAIGSGSNRIAIVAVGHSGANDGDLTGVSVGAMAGTKIVSRQRADMAAWVSLWYVLNPPAGGAVAVACALNASIRHMLACVTYAGALQGSQPDGSDSDNAGSPLSMAVTTAVDNCWAIAWGQGPGIGAGAGVTSLQAEASFGSLLGDSNAAISPAGAYTMELSNAPVGVMATIKPGFGGNMLVVF